ncbi:MAG: sigma-70 family RNA polymerase sigma factor [Bacteroidota bacterium]
MDHSNTTNGKINWPELTRKLRQGENQAWESLISHFTPQLDAYMRIKWNNWKVYPQEAGDTLAKTFFIFSIKIEERKFPKVPGSETEKDYRSYLTQICENDWRNLERKLSKRREDGRVDQDFDIPVLDTEKDLLELDELREAQIQQLIVCLGTLNPDEQDILEMFYFEGMSQKEIATRLEMPYQTVRNKKSKAMKKLRVCFGLNQ